MGVIYMKTHRFASLILFGACFFLAGCGQFGLPDLTRHDEIPPKVKAQPRLVEVPPLPTDATYPRLGDVPFKPNNFSPKPIYNHYMNEMEFDRDSARREKDDVEQEAPAIAVPAAQEVGATSVPMLSAPKLPGN